MERKNQYTFYEYMTELLDYQEFMSYFLEVQFQTKNLMMKQNLRVHSNIADEIVAF